MGGETIAGVAMLLELPFCIYLNDDLYELTVDDQPGAINIWRVARYSTAEELPFKFIAVDPLNCEIRADRFGRVAHTRVCVNLQPYDILDAEGHIDSESAFRKAVKHINRLIEVYRYVTEEYWVQSLTTADLIDAQFFSCNENGRMVPDLTYAMPFDVPGLSPGEPIKVISSGNAIIRSPQVHQKVKEMLKQDNPISVYTRLMLDSRASILFGRFPLSVIEAEIAFESFFYSFVTQELAAKKLLTSLQQSILDKPTTLKQKLSKRLTGKEDLDKLEYFSTLVTTPPRCFAKGVAEHDDWLAQAYSLRHVIVHKGKYDVTETEAKDAFLAVKKAFDFFGKDWRN